MSEAMDLLETPYAGSNEARVASRAGLKHGGMECEGHFEHWRIPEHHFNFMKCNVCGHVWGGDKVRREIARLMRIKVKPTMRKA